VADAPDLVADLDALDDEAAALVFLSTYPRREAKADALKAWRQTRAARPSLSVLVDALARHALVHEWSKERRQFIPLPATWLRGHRWADEFEAELSPLLASRLEKWKAAAQDKAVASNAERLRRIEEASLAAGAKAMRDARQSLPAEKRVLRMVAKPSTEAGAEAVPMGGLLDQLVRRRA